MVKWKVTPDTGVSGSDGNYVFPKNTGTSDIQYTIEVEDDNGCSASTSITVSSGSECQTPTVQTYFMINSQCGIPSGTKFTFDFDDCGIKEYTYNHQYGASTQTERVELENASSCDITTLMNAYVTYPDGQHYPIDPIPEAFGETLFIKGQGEIVNVTFRKILKTREAVNGDYVEIYAKLDLYSDNVIQQYGISVSTVVYIIENFPTYCNEQPREIPTEVLSTTVDKSSESGEAGYWNYYTNEFLLGSYPRRCSSPGGSGDISFTVNRATQIRFTGGDACVGYTCNDSCGA